MLRGLPDRPQAFSIFSQTVSENNNVILLLVGKCKMIATGCALSSLKNFFKIGIYLILLSALVTFIFVKAFPAFAGPYRGSILPY